MDSGDVALHLRPQSFFQVNARMVASLYRQTREWIGLLCNVEGGGSHDLEAKRAEPTDSEAKDAKAKDAKPAGSASADGQSIKLWDLYCGIGGFVLRCAGPGHRVTGVKLSVQAVGNARASAAAAGIDADFIVGDSLSATRELGTTDVAVVSPPRRGISGLISWTDVSQIRFILYSSCNPASLATDATSMPSLGPVRARVFDILPHTDHTETLVLLAHAPRPESRRLPRHSRRSS